MGARDEYPISTVWSVHRLGQLIDMHRAMCDEIDRLWADNDLLAAKLGACQAENATLRADRAGGEP